MLNHFSVGRRLAVVLIRRGAGLLIDSLGAGKYEHYNPVTALGNHTPKLQILSAGESKS